MRWLVADTDSTTPTAFKEAGLDSIEPHVFKDAENPETLQALIWSKPWDVIFIDPFNLNVSVSDVRAWLKNHTSPPVVVVLTWADDLHTMMSTFSEGASAFICKPLQPESIKRFTVELGAEKSADGPFADLNPKKLKERKKRS